MRGRESAKREKRSEEEEEDATNRRDVDIDYETSSVFSIGFPGGSSVVEDTRLTRRTRMRQLK